MPTAENASLRLSPNMVVGAKVDITLPVPLSALTQPRLMPHANDSTTELMRPTNSVTAEATKRCA